MIIARFILRFLVVPFGILAAVTVGLAVIIIGDWNAYVAFANSHPESGEFMIGAMMFAPFIFVVLVGGALGMLAPAAIGILISEFFAIRSWIFHIANGALSAWVGWSLIDRPRGTEKLFQDPKLIVLMGLLAGVTYWLIAGWSAGFWKPVFGRELPPPERVSASAP
ncbi:MAG: hypothetical protein ACXWJW_07225 [Xanthobacteraceae bacterium]